MSERLTVKIVPADGGMDTLTVESAMQQVLDTFRLLTSDGDPVVWRLVSATTNSPFTVVAEADESPAAVQQLEVFSRSLRELQSGMFPMAWRRPELQAAAHAFLRRSASDLSRIEFQVEGGERVVLDRTDAQPFVEVEPDAQVSPQGAPIQPKRQVGSIEGVLVEVFSFRGRPAIRIRERKTSRDITCTMVQELADMVSEQTSMQDVWIHRRVTVRGTVLYNSSGNILRVEATSVSPNPLVSRDLPDITDPTFTGGLTAAEYLHRFREGELG